MKYSEFVKQNKNEIFCKISKSTPEIGEKCIEPFYVPYQTGKVAEGEHLSFVQFPDLIYAIRYGDTYTEFDFSNPVINFKLRNEEIEVTSSFLGEYRAPKLLVGRQASLDEPWVNMQIFCSATDPQIILDLNDKSILEHFEKLGMTHAKDYWEHLYQEYNQAKAYTGSMYEAKRMIQRLAQRELEQTPEPVWQKDKTLKQTLWR